MNGLIYIRKTDKTTETAYSIITSYLAPFYWSLRIARQVGNPGVGIADD